MPASAALEAFIDESIGVAVNRGYTPTIFQRMRRDHGTLEAMEEARSIEAMGFNVKVNFIKLTRGD
jgi:hypothetical protein